MKRTFISAFVMLLAGTSAFAAAPDRVGRWDIGLLGGGAFNDSADDAGYIQGAIAYGVTPYIALGAEVGWQEANGAADESVGVVPILADLIIRMPDWHDQLVPYVTIGLGALSAYTTDEDGSGSLNNGDDVNDTSFGFKLGGGLDWFLTENWIANVEVAFFGGDPDLPATTISDTDFWTFGGGLKYAF